MLLNILFTYFRDQPLNLVGKQNLLEMLRTPCGIMCKRGSTSLPSLIQVEAFMRNTAPSFSLPEWANLALSMK